MKRTVPVTRMEPVTRQVPVEHDLEVGNVVFATPVYVEKYGSLFWDVQQPLKVVEISPHSIRTIPKTYEGDDRPEWSSAKMFQLDKPPVFSYILKLSMREDPTIVKGATADIEDQMEITAISDKDARNRAFVFFRKKYPGILFSPGDYTATRREDALKDA